MGRTRLHASWIIDGRYPWMMDDALEDTWDWKGDIGLE